MCKSLRSNNRNICAKEKWQSWFPYMENVTESYCLISMRDFCAISGTSEEVVCSTKYGLTDIQWPLALRQRPGSLIGFAFTAGAAVDDITQVEQRAARIHGATQSHAVSLRVGSGEYDICTVDRNLQLNATDTFRDKVRNAHQMATRIGSDNDGHRERLHVWMVRWKTARPSTLNITGRRPGGGGRTDTQSRNQKHQQSIK